MVELVAVGATVVFLCATGAVLRRGGWVARLVGTFELGIGGAVAGAVVALMLSFVLWPGAIGAVFGTPDHSLPAGQDGWVSAVFFAVTGGLGAVVPSGPLRLGYAVGALVVVPSLGYWTARGEGALVLAAIASWAAVALVVKSLAWIGRAPDAPGASTRERT